MYVMVGINVLKLILLDYVNKDSSVLGIQENRIGVKHCF